MKYAFLAIILRVCFGTTLIRTVRAIARHLDGMSGAIVIAGMEGYVPEVRHLRKRVLVVRRALHRTRSKRGQA